MLPWLTMAFFANVGGWIADTLISKGFSITSVRKVIVLTSHITSHFAHWYLFCSVYCKFHDGMVSILMAFDVQIMQTIGFLGPAFFLTQLSNVRTPALAVLCMACSQVNITSSHCCGGIQVINFFFATFRVLMHSRNLAYTRIIKT